MNRLINKLIMALALGATLAACSSEDESGGEAQMQQPITFTPMEIATTRASQTTLKALSSYGVSCSVYGSGEGYASAAIGSYFYNKEIATASGVSGYYWPGANYDVSFFAYAPYGNSNLTISSSESKGKPVYTLTVPEDISQQVDFITAEVLDHSGAPTAEKVKLTFNHRCADLRLAIYNRGDDPITVNSITVTGVKYTGSYDGSVWTLSGDANTAASYPFTLTPSANAVVEAGETVDFTDSIHHLILIPQTVASGSAFITVNATIAGQTKDHVYTLPSDFSLEEGKSHYLRISLSAEYIDVDPASDIEDWQVDTKYLTVDGTSTDGSMTQPSASGDGDAKDWNKDGGKTVTDSIKTDGSMTQPGATGDKGTDVNDWDKTSPSSDTNVKPDGSMTQPSTNGSSTTVDDWTKQDGEPTK